MLQYSITSDCGACPTITNATTATCSDFQLTTNPKLCHFSVSSRACNLIGNPSSPTLVTLKGAILLSSVSCKNLMFNCFHYNIITVPDVPQIGIIPSYSMGSQVLERLYMITNQTVSALHCMKSIIMI